MVNYQLTISKDKHSFSLTGPWCEKGVPSKARDANREAVAGVQGANRKHAELGRVPLAVDNKIYTAQLYLLTPNADKGQPMT